MRLVIPMLLLASVQAERNSEFGTYRNPHPRPYERCDSLDLIKLAECCNNVLSKLSACKAGDLACECCALQSMKSECYNLCPRNPSNNFLSVLYKDCEHLNDINACNLPFKKEDGLREKGDSIAHKKVDRMQATLPGEYASSVIIKSKINLKDTKDQKFQNLMYVDDDVLQEEEKHIPEAILRHSNISLPNVTGTYSNNNELATNNPANATKLENGAVRQAWNLYSIILSILFNYIAN